MLHAGHVGVMSGYTLKQFTCGLIPAVIYKLVCTSHVIRVQLSHGTPAFETIASRDSPCLYLSQLNLYICFRYKLYIAALYFSCLLPQGGTFQFCKLDVSSMSAWRHKTNMHMLRSE